ncbi:30S ribosomal protein THX [Desertivirga brevis]|nr:30S ribosomal protein THX [Pedobacter sp. SYSU D00873]
MGRGDKKSKKGKISMGSFGKKRPKQTKKNRAAKKVKAELSAS